MNGLKTDTIINRDALYALRELPEESVHCCVTSPPYYALRDYGLDMQIGREDTPEQYIDRLTEVFRELRRVLRSDGRYSVLSAAGEQREIPHLSPVGDSRPSRDTARSPKSA